MSEVQCLRDAVVFLERFVAALEPDTHTAAGAADLVDLLGRGERLCAAGKALAARRVEECGAWRRDGFRSGAHWLAARSGTTVGEAEGALRVARTLTDLPATEVAFRSGELSAVQAREIVETAVSDPAAEVSLLATASGASVKVLRDECRRVRAASVADDAAWAARRVAARRLDRWKDPDGMGRGDWKLPPADAARVNAALDAEIERMYRSHRGLREPRAVLAADALVHLVTRGPHKPPEVKVTVDAAALARGFLRPGERCEIDGLGPVPVRVATAMLRDASVSLLVRGESGELECASRATRTVPAGLRRRIEARDPVCANHDCRGDGPFEIDHIVPVEEHGPTDDANCWRLCRHCHRRKTYAGWRVEVGADGRRRLVPPRSGGP